MKYMLIDISLINCFLDIFELSIWLKNVSFIFLTGFPLRTQFFPEFSYPCKSKRHWEVPEYYFYCLDLCKSYLCSVILLNSFCSMHNEKLTELTLFAIWRVQQIQLLGRDMKGPAHDKLWNQLEAEIHLHRHKTVIRACRGRNDLKRPMQAPPGHVGLLCYCFPLSLFLLYIIRSSFHFCILLVFKTLI